MMPTARHLHDVDQLRRRHNDNQTISLRQIDATKRSYARRIHQVSEVPGNDDVSARQGCLRHVERVVGIFLRHDFALQVGVTQYNRFGCQDQPFTASLNGSAEQVLNMEGFECAEQLTATVDGRTLTWTERRLVVRSLQQAAAATVPLNKRLAQAEAAIVELNTPKQGKTPLAQLAALQQAGMKCSRSSAMASTSVTSASDSPA